MTHLGGLWPQHVRERGECVQLDGGPRGQRLGQLKAAAGHALGRALGRLGLVPPLELGHVGGAAVQLQEGGAVQAAVAEQHRGGRLGAVVAEVQLQVVAHRIARGVDLGVRRRRRGGCEAGGQAAEGGVPAAAAPLNSGPRSVELHIHLSD